MSLYRGGIRSVAWWVTAAIGVVVWLCGLLTSGFGRGAAPPGAGKLPRFWLAVGAIGFLFVPWYSLQNSVFALSWIPRFTSKEAAPALPVIVQLLLLPVDEILGVDKPIHVGAG